MLVLLLTKMSPSAGSNVKNPPDGSVPLDGLLSAKLASAPVNGSYLRSRAAATNSSPAGEISRSIGMLFWNVSIGNPSPAMSRPAGVRRCTRRVGLVIAPTYSDDAPSTTPYADVKEKLSSTAPLSGSTLITAFS